MYASLNRKDVKALNRLDKRRRMKYDGRHKETRDAEELRAAREEVGEAEVRNEGQLSRTHLRHSPNYR